MKIALCGSMSAAAAMQSVGSQLENAGHHVILPSGIDDHIHAVEQRESSTEKIERDVYRTYFEEIKKADAILVVNEEKNGIKDYIGPNTLIEMAFAHVLEKKIYLLHTLPDSSFRDEIIAFHPECLDGSFSSLPHP